MANAITYIKNVGKSVTYASIDVIKEMNPVFSDFAETNGELATDMYKSIKNIKKNIRELPNKIMQSKGGKFAKTYLDNLVSDIKTGQLYNKERISKDEDRIARDMMGGGFDDFDFDGGDSDDDFGNLGDLSDLDSFEDDDDSFSSNEMMDIVGEKASTAVATATARSAEYIVEGIGQSNKAIYNQMNTIYGGIHTGMSTINQNIAKILEFSSEAVTTHFNNSSTFYETITRLDQERNNYLKEILDTVKLINNPPAKEAAKKDNKYSNLISYEGVLDISGYVQHIKKNLKDNSGGMVDMISMMMETGMLETLASSPLSGAVSMAVRAIIPEMIEDATERFNKTLSGMAGAAFMKLNQKAKKEGGIWESIASIFGISTRLRTGIDPASYEKGQIPFDGITKKSIVEVIPTYLSKILSALTGRKEDRFNYDTGKFVTIDELKKEFDDITINSANTAAYELNNLVNTKKKDYRFESEAERKQFESDWDAMKLYMFKNQKDFNTRDKDLKGKDFGLTETSDKNIKLLQEWLDGSHEALRYSDSIFRETEKQNSRMIDIQNSGSMSALVNRSIDNKPADTNIISNVISDINNSILDEVKAIHKELSYIRNYGLRGSVQSSENTGELPNFDSFVTPQSQGSKKDKKEEPKENTEENKYEYKEEEKKKDEEDKNKKKKPLSEQLADATGFSAKMSILLQGAKDLAKKPAEFVVSMLDKADQRLYDVIYGPKAEEDPQGKKSFIGRLFKNLDDMFNKFSDFVTSSIIDPLKNKFTKENAHEAARKFFGIFGIDIDKSVKSVKEYLFGEKGEDGKRKADKKGLFGGLIDGVKSEFKSAFGWVKNTFKEFGEWTGITGKHLNKSGRAKKAHNDGIDNQLNALEKLMGNTAQISETPEAASGMKRVDKTGLAVISEGEMILPPDMNPFNIIKRKRGEKQVKKNLKDSIDDIFEYNKGTIDAASGEEMSEEDFEIAMEAAQAARSLRAKKQDIGESDYGTFKERMVEEISDASKLVVNSLKNTADTFGIKEEEKDKFKKNALTFMGKVKEHGATMVTGATIGAGLSLVTGLIGGPLVGAAVGAGVGLIKKSEAVQEMLFGEIGKDGERTGGLISKDLSNDINKYFPDMGKGATIGGILAALPFVPGGPVAGIILGSSIGFAKNNDTIQKALFGENLEKKEAFQNKVRSVLPKMGVGALAGLLAGPFGSISANLILGSAIGFASDTEKFKSVLFGEVGPDNKRHGGIFGAITGPAVDLFQKMYHEFKDFVVKDMIQPVADAIQPIKKQFEIIGKTISDSIKSLFKDHIVVPIQKFLKDKVLSPVGKLFGWLVKPVTDLVKFTISAPSRLIGGIGNTLRRHQIKTGDADYMNAEQRIAFRDSQGWKMRFGDPRKDRFDKFDRSIAGMDVDKLRAVTEAMEGVKDSQTDIKTLRQRSYKTISKSLRSSSINYDTAKTVKQLIENGQYEKALNFVKKSKIDDENVRKSLLDTIATESAKISVSYNMSKDSEKTVKEIGDRFRKFGLDLDERTIKKLANGDKEAQKLLNMAKGELKYKEKNEITPDEKEEKDESRHNEITKFLEDINNSLKILSGQVNPKHKKEGQVATNLEQETERYQHIADLPLDAEDDGGVRHDTFVDNIRNRYRSRYKGKGLFGKAFALAGDAISLGTMPIKVGGKVVKGTAGLAGKTIKGAYNIAKTGVKTVRESDVGKTIWGDKSRNKDWQTQLRNPFKKKTESDETQTIVEAETPKAEDNNTDNKKDKGNMNVFKSIERGILKLAGIALATAYKDGIRTDNVDETKGSKNYFSKIKSKFGKAKTTVTQFFDGKAVKFRRNKDGDLEPDNSNEDTQQYQKDQKEKEEREKGILGALTSIPSVLGGLFTKIFGKDEKEESLFSKIMGKVFSGAKFGLAIAGALGVAGWAKDKIFPALKTFWDEKLGPYLNDAWNGKKDGFGQFIYFFNPKNENGVLPFLTKTIKTLATYVSDGVSWVTKDVLPVVVSTIVQTAPDIVKGIVKGVKDGIEALIHPESKNDGTMNNAEITGLALGSVNSLKSISSTNTKPSWFDSSVDVKPLSETNNKSNIVQSSSSGSITSSVNKNKETTLKSSKTKNTLSKVSSAIASSVSTTTNSSLPKAFQVMNQVYREPAIEEYNKVKDNIIETDYGPMTVEQILNSDQVFAYTEDGTPLHGYEFMNYNNLAQSLGMDIRLSEEQMKANAEAQGVDTNKHPVLSKILSVSGKSFMKGMAHSSAGVSGAEKFIKGTSNVLSKVLKKVPIVGNVASKVTKFTGDKVSKIPGFFNRAGSKFSDKFNIFKASKEGAGEVAESALSGKGKKSNIFTKAKDTVKKVTETIIEAPDKAKKSGKMAKVVESAKKSSKLNKFIATVTEAVKGFFKDSKIYGFLSDAIKSVKGSKAKKLTKEGVESLGEYFAKNLDNLLIKHGGKVGAKVAAKITGYVASGAVLMIADAIISFVSGMTNAKSILGIIEEPSTLMTVLCGIMEAMNSVFLCGIVPLDTVVDLVIGGAELLGLDVFDELSEQRKHAKEEVAKYAKERGITDFTVEDYNKKDSLWTKTKKVASDVGNWVSETTSSIFGNKKKKEKDAADDTIKKATDKISGPVGGIGSLFTASGRGSGLPVGRGSATENRFNRLIKRSQIREWNQSQYVSNNTFISQLDSKYKDKKFNISSDTENQTLGDTGCAPAAAAMAVNATLGQNRISMEQASKLALNYKVKNDGVNAAYFNDEFARNGINTNYITTQNPEIRKREIVKQLIDHNKVVLMGTDATNKSKSESPFGPNPHYVVANGLSKDGKYIYINDPEAKTANIKYDVNKVLNNSELGISASVARGTKSKLANKFKKFIARGKYGKNTIQYKVWTRLRGAGFTEVQVAGVMGNIQHESAFDPAVVEKGRGIGFGLVQWSYSRRTQIEAYAKSKGVSANDVNTQIDFLIAEMTPGGGANGYANYEFMASSTKYDGKKWPANSFSKANTIEDATRAFCFCFERPANASSINKRIKAAREYYQEFTGTEPALSVDSTYMETSNGTSSESNFLTKLFGLFGDVASQYGINGESIFSKRVVTTDDADTSSTGNSNDVDIDRMGDSTTIKGNVSSNPTHAIKQKQLVQKMYSVYGKLKYAQNNSKYPGSRNPADGSGDCSSTVQWAYKNILGVDPGSWTGAQRTDSDTYTVARSLSDESKLQLGDLLLRDGHVEMYAGDGKMIGHGGGNDGKTYGPTVKKLDKSGKYDLVRRWIGFKNGKGSDIPTNGAYDNALRHIKPEKLTSIYPLGYEAKEINNKVPDIQYNINKLSDKSIKKEQAPIHIAKGSQYASDVQTVREKTVVDNTELIKSIIKLLIQVVTNTNQLNTIVKLLGEYVSTVESSDGSKKSKEATVLAKQNLIHAIQGGNDNKPNAQLMKLIEVTEKIAKE